MRWRNVLILVVSVFAACNSPPTIYSPDDLYGAAPSGNFRPFTDYLSTGSGKTTVFLLHGVGDHCPGFGLDPSYG
jgi:hypothetical protein